MKRIFQIVLLLGSLSLCAVAQPSMTVRDGQKRLAVDRADITVRLHGDVAETEMELWFRNDENRMLEGEFVLPLPAGATVSSYALEVNGALREAVAVEKDKARHAYESIKARMVDPGLVERERDNTYRTRVFPIPAEGKKHMRIGYVEVVENGSYRLPLKFDGILSSFKLRIEGDEDLVASFENEVPEVFRNGGSRREFKAKDCRSDGFLVIPILRAGEPRLMIDDGPEAAFMVTDRFPDLPDKERASPKSIRLLWDASESAAADRSKTLAVLGGLFKKWGTVKVDLVFVRNETESGGVHEIRKGNWSSLRKILENTTCEGASSFEGIGASAGADLIVYCGDGVSTIGGSIGKMEKPLLFLAEGGITGELQKAAQMSGGTSVDVNAESTDDVLRKILRMNPRVLGVKGAVDGTLVFDPAGPGKTTRLFGRLTPGKNEVEVLYGAGDVVIERRKFVREEKSEAGMIKRLWAQRVLGDLENTHRPDKAAILEHCKRHTLVSDETSLIVLELFEDHVKYEIPPPEPELLAKYQEEIASKKSREERSVKSDWDKQLAWHDRVFPTEEYRLMPRVRQTGIWLKAFSTAFRSPEKYPNFKAISDWQERTRMLIGNRPKLKTETEYKAWLTELRALTSEGKEFSKIPTKAAAAGEEIEISVRGGVFNPAFYRVKSGTTFREAIRTAGGAFNDDLRFALYRNGGKRVFNIGHQEFQDFPVLPGDMIVVQESPYRWIDGFHVSGPEERGSVSDTDEDVWIEEYHGFADPFGSPMAGAKREEEKEVVVLRKAKGEVFPIDFYIKNSKLLFAAGKAKEGSRLLSTIVERSGGDVPSLFAYMFWLLEYGRNEEAARVLGTMNVIECGAVGALLLAELENKHEAAAAMLRTQAAASRHDSAMVLMSEVDAIAPKNQLPDLQITVACDRGDLQALEIEDPTGAVIRNGGGSVNDCGGRLTGSQNVAVFMTKRALSGGYSVRFKTSPEMDVSLRITVRTFIEGKATVTRSTKFVPAGTLREVATAEMPFKPAAE